MKKKLFATIIACILLLSGALPAAADAYNSRILTTPELVEGNGARELITNGGFELMATENSLYGWGSGVGGTINQSNLFVVTNGRDNTNALSITSDKDKYAHVLQSIDDVVPGETYELSAWGKRMTEDATNVYLSLMFFSKNENNREAETGARLSLSFGTAPLNTWEKRIVNFTVPEGITRMTLLVRLMYGGTIVYDDVSLLTTAEGEEEEVTTVKKEPISGNLLDNGGFETMVGTKLKDWYAYGGAKGDMSGSYVTIDTENVRSGNQSIKISDPVGNKLPWISCSNTPLEPGAQYQVQLYVKSSGTYAVPFAMTYEYNYDSPATVDGWMVVKDGLHRTFQRSDEWKEVLLDMEMPADARSGLLRIRLFNELPGTYFYVDDVSLYKTKEAPVGFLETDEIFYYTEWKTGTATFEQYHFAESLNGETVAFTLLDGTRTIASDNVTIEDRQAAFDFDLDLLAEIGKEYTMKATVMKDGAPIFEATRPVYRYNRPTYLHANGVFEKNGKKTNFVLGNGVSKKVEDYAGDIGLTVIQATGGSSDTRTLTQRLDDAWARGQYVLITLYSGTKSAGHPDQLANTISAVTTAKSHPATFGYKIQDEPMGKGNSDEELRRAYKTVRDIDPDHPVYTDDSGYGSYRQLGWYCDIMDIDYYPAGSANRSTAIIPMMEYAVAAVRGRKPVSLLQQAFLYHDYFPTANHFRHYAYQVFFVGASGFGFHSFGEENGLNNQNAAWEGLCDWAEWEQDFMFDCFVNERYPQLNEERTSSAWWRTYVKDNKIYAIILNLHDTAVNTANVSLTDFDNTIAVNGFTAKRIAGGTPETVNGDGSVFTLQLEGQAAYVYEITPRNTMDFTGVKTTKYRDLSSYPWARSAVANLEAHNIVNDSTQVQYAPAQNVTRGDFAMFLVRALGLTATETANFSDVPQDAYYAREIAVGKALGVLNGVGGNLFNPESDITRQDLMAIAARGMRLKKALDEGKEEDLQSYADAPSVADYAVLDIAAMVRANIVKGNADGTLNPLGKTTRAEAAVIANRIFIWQSEP